MGRESGDWVLSDRSLFVIKGVLINMQCIDQDNLEERAHQVRIMRDIYAQASDVIVFLGDGWNHRVSVDSRDSSPPFEAEFHSSSLDNGHIASLFQRWVSNDVPHKASAMDVFSFIAMQARGQPELFYHEANEKGRDLKGLFEALRMMLLSPWWSRMWMFQEAILARRLTVRYGGITCPWNMFTQAADTRSGSDLLVSGPSRKVLVFFSKLVTGVAQNRESRASILGEQLPEYGATDMLALLRATAARKASDDRDKVFALLGLVSTNMERVIFPSYEISTEDVYTATVSQIIAQGRSLAPLYGDLGRKNRKDLPSWVPDWSAVINEQEINRIHCTGLYNACSNDNVEFISSIRILWSYAASCLESIYQCAKSFRTSLYPTASLYLRSVTRSKEMIKRSGLISIHHPFENTFMMDSLRASWGGGPTPDLLAGNEIPAPLWMNRTCFSNYDSTDLCPMEGCHLPGRKFATVSEVGEIIVGPITPDELRRLCRSYSELEKYQPIRPHSLRALVFYLKVKDGHITRLFGDDDDAIEQWFRSRSHSEETADVYGPDRTDPLGFDEIIGKMAVRRRLFVTMDHRLGWGPAETQPGDHIYILPGGKVPFVLRRQGGKAQFVFQRQDWPQHDKYGLIGDCIIQGAMDGEMCQDVEWGAVLLPPLSWTGCDSYINKGYDGRLHQLEWRRHLVEPFHFIDRYMDDYAKASGLAMVTLI